jgi:tetratricopeptide (TPR) repeat protein
VIELDWRRAFRWLAVFVALVWAGGISGGYHFDDSHSVEANLAVRSLSNIPTFWTDTRTSSFIPENRVYRPMVYTFYSFCWLIGGGKTWPFHLMKMLMHVLVCLGLFRIWARLWREPGWFPVKDLRLKIPLISHVFELTPDMAAFFLAAVFAIHPVMSECVDYISSTTSLQCAMFYVWAYYCWLRYRDSGRFQELLYALALYFLSVASKEEGITLPAMVFFTEIFLAKGAASARIAKGIRSAMPFGIEMLALGGWIYAMHPESGNESRGWVTPFQYFITQWRAYLWYMRLWFWPFDLNADSASIEFSKSLTDSLVIQAALGNLLLVAFAWFNRRRFPALLFGLVWYYVTISPASSVVVLAEAVNERRMYLSYIGFTGGTFVVLLFCAERFFDAATRPRFVGAIFSLCCLGLVVGAQERNRVWETDENLWQDTVEKNPTSGRALNNLGLVYMSRGDYEKTIGYLEKCEQYWPTYMYCSLNLGISRAGVAAKLEAEGKKDEAAKRWSEAEKSFDRAYQLNPKSVHVNFHLGKYFEERKQDYAKAAEFYQAAIDLTGGRYPDAEIRRAQCLTRLKRFDDAEAALGRALDVEPANQVALFQKAATSFEAGRRDDAIALYEKLLEMNPRHVQAWYNIGVAQLAKPDLPEARKAFEKTVEIDPRSQQGWYNLSFVSERLGDGKSALGAAHKLLEIDPGRAEFRKRTAELEKKYGQGG